ncbi:tRNA epoxyqueuosine(34) reductase QueG [Clostridium swellfunianum]|uniref:tRNA epoxyqueuosine(34) reductase QueG n=1 Tax=Clostridium swellfunianum TaxID=1367462 RepID=UPI00202EC017|nr:tRNA epoxyqueuosine(34) reductase QueG [Clostridium swellfunianum]MCM0646852.1 tRNA epoxyqueuosine(34) reductase QueG [Clostridium swellfunianum]
MNYKQNIMDFCKGLGLDTIGFCKCRRFDELKCFFEERKHKALENEFEEKDVEKRINPFIHMEQGRTIISFAFPYLHDVEKSSDFYFSKYTRGRDYHIVVSNYLKMVCNHIETMGGKAIYFVDSNPLPERYIAYLCGIGFIGKNNMLITEKYGSYVFLGEIITDLEIEIDKPIEQKCGECSLCLKECPTKAINKGGSCPNVCLSYITQRKHIEDVWFDKLGGRIFGCDSCQDTCPFNMRVKLSNIEEFIPYEHMKDVNSKELLNIDNNIFKEKYSVTSCGWRGKNILQRNILINEALLNKTLDIDEKTINSPYVKDYYHRLLKALQL